MIGITNPPGRFILQIAHDVVLVNLLWCADSTVTGGAGMPDADEVPGSARVSPIAKRPKRHAAGIAGGDFQTRIARRDRIFGEPETGAEVGGLFFRHNNNDAEVFRIDHEGLAERGHWEHG